MKRTNKQNAIDFSNGEFTEVFPHLADSVVWNLFDQGKIEGKESVIDECKRIAAYFETVDTDFQITFIIQENNKIAINGVGIFSRNGNLLSDVNSCDIYEFDENNLIISISSYCITTKK
jgi:hypothetical protein